MSDSGRVSEILDDRPDLEEPLQKILDVEERSDSWTFGDVPLDSGRFGELVSRGIVESVGEEYRLAKPDAVRAALAQRSAAPADETSPDQRPDRVDIDSWLSKVDGPTAAIVGGAILLNALVRLLPFPDVYRNGDIVLSGNDPYHYRYLVEKLLAQGPLPPEVTTGEPLFVGATSLLADLLGGTATAAGHALAWYPVVTAVIAGLLVYLLSLEVTDDHRIALAAVLIFALIPGHVFRTSLGFGDHHAFDYLWLALTALAVTKLATVESRSLRSRSTAILTGVAGVAIACQVLAWNAGPLLLVPIAVLVPARAAIDILRETSPVPAGVPPIIALFCGAAIAAVIHFLTGMLSTFIALSPAVLGVWATLTLALAVSAHQYEVNPRYLLTAYILVVFVGFVVVINGPQTVRATVIGRVLTLFRGDEIFETQSLFDPTHLGFLFQFGFALLLALPSMLVGLGRSLDDGRWLVVSTYAWIFLILATIQVRFSGELAAFVAIFAAYSFVVIAARLDLLTFGSEDPRRLLRPPGRRRGAVLIVLFVVVIGGVGAVQSSDMMDTLAVEDDVYETATYLSGHADERGLDYPDNYVLSDWGDNRVYNYFVNGESLSYGYAQANYSRFAGSTQPEAWYNHRFNRSVGYVVLALALPEANQNAIIYRLTRHYGSATDGVPGVGHYRVIYVSDSGARTAVSVVNGATITGLGEAGSSVTVSTHVDAEGASFDYTRRTRVGNDGHWNVTVAHPGRYDIRVGNTSTRTIVSETAVRAGASVSVPE